MSSKAENCALSDPFANPLHRSPWENSRSIEKICKKETALALKKYANNSFGFKINFYKSIEHILWRAQTVRLSSATTINPPPFPRTVQSR